MANVADKKRIVRFGQYNSGHYHTVSLDYDAFIADRNSGMTYTQLMEKYGIRNKTRVLRLLRIDADAFFDDEDDC